MVPGELYLLERDRERALLAESVDYVLGGSGRLVVIEGPAGIGKTQLLTEARALGNGAGLRVLNARGSQLEQAFAFGLVRQLFEALLVSADPQDCARWLDGAAGQAMVALSRAEPKADETGDFAVLHGLYWLSANVSQDRPLMLAVDDVQWADTPSLRFLAYLLGRLESIQVLLILATRQGERSLGSDRLADQILTDPNRVHLQPNPLSPHAVASLINAVLRPKIQIQAEFVEACHSTTGGNPLLLYELLSVVAAEGWTPTADYATRILDLGSRAVARHVALRFDRLPDAAVALAHAVALLGDHTQLGHAAALSHQDLPAASRAAADLQHAGILQVRTTASASGSQLSYHHPLIRAAVYQGMPLDERLNGHSRAADMLEADSRVEPETVAAHLLAIPPTSNPMHADTLRQASAAALARGAPDVASVYLRRCLSQPLSDAERLDVLVQAGSTTLMVDTVSAADYLAEALELAKDPARRADIAVRLAPVYVSVRRYDEAEQIWQAGLSGLPEEERDLNLALRAARLVMSLVTPNRPGGLAEAEALRQEFTTNDLRTWDALGVVSDVYCYDGDPVGIELARQSLATGQLTKTGSPGLLCAWNCLVFADDRKAEASIEAGLADSHERGAIGRLVGAYSYRCLSRMRRGELVDAEADGRECQRLTELSQLHIARPHIGSWLAEVLIEQGKLADAAATMAWVGVPDPIPESGAEHYYLSSLVRLQHAQGHVERALETAMAVGQRFRALGGRNPAVIPWRSEAALCLHALGRTAEARELIGDELRLAHRWGAPGALGRAQRIAGLVTGGAAGLDLLQQAVSTLEPSLARLEYAKALIDYGAALRRSKYRAQALKHLRLGVEIADLCNAVPLAEQGTAEIRTAGAKPRSRITLAGPAALTHSERRVAELAADGHSNKEIAQLLFITTKTVEVHLSNVYRKIGVNRRQLSHELLSPEAEASTD